MNAELSAPPAYPLWRALVLTLLGGAPGLATLLFDFPSVRFSLVGVAWKVATLGVAIGAIVLFERRRPRRVDLGLVRDVGDGRTDRAPIALIGSTALLGLSFFWGSIPGLRELAPAGDPSSYGTTNELTNGLLALELLVRYPATVLAEEAFFRGFLQSRLAVAAPVVAGVLFALYHVQQWTTIPSLIPFGIALGLLRWWTGSIWPGAAFHYAGNAIFILSLR